MKQTLCPTSLKSHTSFTSQTSQIFKKNMKLKIFPSFFLLNSFQILLSEEFFPPFNHWLFPNENKNNFHSFPRNFQENSQNEENLPCLALSFIHMRKAGGTSFLELLKRWMK